MYAAPLRRAGSPNTSRTPVHIISNNRKAFHEYTISDKFEAGIALTGPEVKSARAGKVNLADGWVDITPAGDAILHEVHISKYADAGYAYQDEKRPRRLLLHKKEIAKLAQKIDEQGYTVVPIQMYFKEQFIKVEIAIARGKKLHDKRDAAKTKEANRDIARALRDRNR